MHLALPILRSEARSVLTRTSGFIAEAGFTHSLTPARNCTFGCSYCYVPTMRLFGGLKPDDWRRWGQFTTLKTNAAALLANELRGGQIIYCSPLVDPYQPTEDREPLMPAILAAVAARPPRGFVLQTRGPLILRDLERLARVPRLRVSFSITTDREDVRRRYEPRCASFERRLEVIRQLNAAGIVTHATLAPLLPANVEALLERVMEATPHALVADPLHVRAVKKHGATTREAALSIARKWGDEAWFDPGYQAEMVQRMAEAAGRAGRTLLTGPAGFAQLASF